MQSFVLMTDSCCDLSAEMAAQLGLEVLPMTVDIEDQTFLHYPDERELSFKTFYQELRAGRSVSTSAINPHTFYEAFEAHLQQGRDVLYIGFSSALSSTFAASQSAAQELAAKYPARNIFVVDSLCASMGQGLLVYLCAMQRAAGSDICAVKHYAEQTRLQVCHWFTVEDLKQLRRGGRVSAASAIVGDMLHIKPVLHVDNAGRLIPMRKVRGRKASIKAMFHMMCEQVANPAGQTVFISHGDCEAEARGLGAQILAKWPDIQQVVYNPIGPVIGAHTGAGVLALFFLGSAR